MKKYYELYELRKKVINEQEIISIETMKEELVKMRTEYGYILKDFDNQPSKHRFEKKTQIFIKQSVENYLPKHPRLDTLPKKVNFHKENKLFDEEEENPAVTEFIK